MPELRCNAPIRGVESVQRWSVVLERAWENLDPPRHLVVAKGGGSWEQRCLGAATGLCFCRSGRDGGFLSEDMVMWGGFLSEDIRSCGAVSSRKISHAEPPQFRCSLVYFLRRHSTIATRSLA